MLRMLTNKALRSILHCLISHPHALEKTRYSFAYFMRPNGTVPLKVAEGDVCPSLQWHFRKGYVFQATQEVQDAQQEVLKGRI